MNEKVLALILVVVIPVKANIIVLHRDPKIQKTEVHQGAA
jgi:hypothetical protein